MTTETELTLKGELVKLTLEAGDVLVITLPDRLSPEQRDRITEQLNNFFPSNRCLVLSSGMKLQVVSPKAETPENSEPSTPRTINHQP